MPELPKVITVLTILKRFIASGIQVDAQTRAQIAEMNPEDVFAFARDLVAVTDQKAGEFIERLENVSGQ
jgi:hypothetical protein